MSLQKILAQNDYESDILLSGASFRARDICLLAAQCRDRLHKLKILTQKKTLLLETYSTIEKEMDSLVPGAFLKNQKQYESSLQADKITTEKFQSDSKKKSTDNNYELIPHTKLIRKNERRRK